MDEQAKTVARPKVLADLYPDGLSQAQARRIVALLRLAQPRRGSEQPERRTTAA